MLSNDSFQVNYITGIFKTFLAKAIGAKYALWKTSFLEQVGDFIKDKAIPIES